MLRICVSTLAIREASENPLNRLHRCAQDAEIVNQLERLPTLAR